jgi:hypothetical protein
VLQAIDHDPDSAVAKALSTPWHLTLAVTVYGQRHARTGAYLQSPSDLVSPALSTCAAVRSQLLALFSSAVVATYPIRRRRRSRSNRYYNSDRVTKWLRHLARCLGDQGVTQPGTAPHGTSRIDLIPHLLWPIAGEIRIRCLHAVFAGTIAALGIAVAIWIGIGPPDTWLAALRAAAGQPRNPLPDQFELGIAAAGFVLTPLLVAARCAERWPIPASATRARNVRASLAAGLAVGFVVGLGTGLVVGFWIAPTAGVLTGVTAGLAVGIGAGFAGAPITWSEEVSVASPQAPLRQEAARGLATGLATGLTMGLAGWLVTGPLDGLGFGLAGWIAVGLCGGLAGGLAVWIASRMIGELTGGFTSGLSVWLAGWLALGMVSGLMIGIASSFEVPFADWLIGGLVLGTTFGSATLVAVPSGRYAVGVALAAAQGKSPWRLGHFLDWAYNAGLLRVAGSAYQFRHDELKTWLGPSSP